MRLCNDKDLFKWEPKLFSEAISQRYLCRGSGAVVSGTDFSAADIDFQFCGIEAGGIIHIWNELAGIDLCLEIISVGENGHLAISAVRPDDVTVPWSPGNYSNLDYAIISYSPIIEEVSYYLVNKYELAEKMAFVTDSRRLKLCCVFAVLSASYASTAISESDASEAVCWAKSNYYRNRYDEYRGSLELELDLDGDGDTDQTLSGAVIKMERK